MLGFVFSCGDTKDAGTCSSDVHTGDAGICRSDEETQVMLGFVVPSFQMPPAGGLSRNLTYTLSSARQVFQVEVFFQVTGWGADIDWVKTYEEGLMKSKSSLKPLMVIHHLLDCPFSIALKKAFAANAEIQKLAKEDFIMLNIVNETSDKNMAPDGYYVPRIILVDPSLTVRTDIVGKHKKNKYTYEPNDIPLLIENMKKAKMVLHKEL
ncbi:anterior gradient protein 3-like [Latimeria chalumnae]|uniref:anterior gradient protein 3-like n=1 Tax=Latimeria chalumnae TaxID=7897 RepID=UPI0003C13F4B